MRRYMIRAKFPAGAPCTLMGVSELRQPTPIIQIWAGRGYAVALGFRVQNGGSARGYRGAGRPLSSPGMAYRIVVCTVYLSIAPHGVNVRICRRSGEAYGAPVSAEASAYSARSPTVLAGWAGRWAAERAVAVTPGDWVQRAAAWSRA